MLTAHNIHKSYGSVNVLRGVNLSIQQGEIISIVGSSGAGKSTLLHIIGTLDRADQGRVTINDQEVDRLADKKLARFRNANIGFVFQFHHLLPEFTAEENVSIPAMISDATFRDVNKKAGRLLDLLGMSDRFDHKPAQLSGGEQQRVAVARALINDPGLILADEPSGNLDSETSEELHRLFFQLRDELDQTFVIVTHNRDLARMADRMLTMRDGEFVD
ncbi:MAG: lipoprotein-releasing system ATP-binding protein LolD [Bacteroidetes bacterium SW_11_45_7]|nr:MAG: lipoprotein-releasing system ATP-binding protein LolD [Bacteroidetes bacterium SW_11_45_7]